MITDSFLHQETAIYSVEEYFEIEALSNDKLEYRNGKIVEMPGAKPTHNLIAGWIIRLYGIAV